MGFSSILTLQPTLCVNITITDDDILENNEYFSVTINNTDDSSSVGSPTSVIIVDNDGEAYKLEGIYNDREVY